jgi:hypothetical protein
MLPVRNKSMVIGGQLMVKKRPDGSSAALDCTNVRQLKLIVSERYGFALQQT